MKIDNLTGITYPDQEDNYEVFENWVQEMNARSYFSNIRDYLVLEGFDSSVISYDENDRFQWTGEFSFVHPITQERVTLNGSTAFPNENTVQIRDGATWVFVIPSRPRALINVLSREVFEILPGDYTYFVLGRRRGSELTLFNGQIVNV